MTAKRKMTKQDTAPRKNLRSKKDAAPAEGTVEKEVEVIEEEEMVGGRRLIVNEAVIDKEFFSNHLLEDVNHLLAAQGWEHLFQDEVVIDEELLREFYETLEVKEVAGLVMATFVIKGQGKVMTHSDLGGMLKVSAEGFAEYVKGTWPSSIAKSEVLQRVGETEGDALKLGVVKQTLHRLIITNITPRRQKHQDIFLMDYLLMDKLLSKEKVSLPRIVLLHMKHIASSTSHALCYPGIVKKMLEYSGVYVCEDEKVFSTALKLETYDKLGWKFDVVAGWMNEKYGLPAILKGLDPSVEVKIEKGGNSNEQQEILEKLAIADGKLNQLLAANRMFNPFLFRDLEKIPEVVGKVEMMIEKHQKWVRVQIEESVVKNQAWIKDQIEKILKEIQFVADACLEVSEPSKTVTKTPDSGPSTEKKDSETHA